MSNKSVFITGCSDYGMGAALALELHKKGYRVIASARDTTKLSQVRSVGIETVVLDVQSDESIEQAVEGVAKTLDERLDILINNAGAGYAMPIMDIRQDRLEQIFDLNVFSLIRVTKAFLPMLRAAGGAVVNNTSVAGTMYVGPPFHGGYNAAKAAAAMLSHNLRLELAPFGIKVIDLRTATVQTQFLKNIGNQSLPPDSIYSPARNAIERFMKGDELGANAQPAQVWAESIVRDISGSSPPNVIWRGGGAMYIWLLSFFPSYWFDGFIKKLVGLDVLEEQLKKQ